MKSESYITRVATEVWEIQQYIAYLEWTIADLRKRLEAQDDHRV
jgi:hypothetical protein